MKLFELKGADQGVAVLPEQAGADTTAAQHKNYNSSNNQAGITLLGFFGGGRKLRIHGFLQQ